ncbi:MAG: aldehyde dehydrogenase (NADP(+)), partial [Limisphaerales bacterium]
DQFAAKLTEGLKGASGCMLNADIASAYREALSSRAGLSGDGIEVLHSQAGEENSTVGSAVYKVTAQAFLANPVLAEEAFGPATTLVTYESESELLEVINAQEGQLTGTIHGTEADLAGAGVAIAALEGRVGRLIFGGFPTGVEVCHGMVHGGPFPSTSDGRSTSVGTMAIGRFTRPVSYQNAPDGFLPAELRSDNPLGITRLLDGKRTTDSL